MGSPSAASGSPSSGGTKTQAKNYAKKNEPNIIDKGLKKIKDKIYGGPEKGVLAETYSPKYGKYDVPGSLSDPREKDDTAAKASLFREQGAISYQDSYASKTMLGALLSGVAKESSRATRSFFKNEVLGKGAYKDLSVQDFEKKTRTAQEGLYQKYIQGRSKGELDAYGQLMPGYSKENIKFRKADGTMTTREVVMKTDRDPGNGGGAIGSSGQVVQAPTVTAPTTAELSQSAATDVAEDDILLRKRRAKARGRSPTIMTGVTGATGSLTLGKPSLLGRA